MPEYISFILIIYYHQSSLYYESVYHSQKEYSPIILRSENNIVFGLIELLPTFPDIKCVLHWIGFYLLSLFAMDYRVTFL